MENKSYDNQLVAESKLSFTNNYDINTLTLNDNGMVESILNGKVVESFPFSKQSVNDKCTALFKEGYKLNEIDVGNDNIKADILNDTANTKKELQQQLDDVEEIKKLKDEIDVNMDEILDESKITEANDAETSEEPDSNNADNTTGKDCGIVILSKDITGNYIPDVAVKYVSGDNLMIAENLDEIMPLDKESGSKIVKDIRNEMGENRQWKIELWTLDKIAETAEFWENAKNEDDGDISDTGDVEETSSENDVSEDVDTSEEIAENENKTESLLKESFAEESSFPASEYTAKVLTPEEICNLEQCYRDNLTPEQIIWINGNIDDIVYVIEGFIGLLELIDLPENVPFMSIDEYLGELINEEVPNDENV